MAETTSRSLQHTLWLKASPRQVWRALTEGRHLRRWFTIPEALELRKAGRWDFLGFPGRVLRVAREKTFSHSHTFSPGTVSRMTYDLRPSGRYTQLVVLHDRFGQDAKTRDCWRGAWPFILSNLKTYVESGTPMWETSFKGKAD